jgi:serine/threonine-protein kinase
MGVVVAAWHLELEQAVAIKFLNPAVLGASEALERFRREARAAASIKSEHVVRVLDVGAMPDGLPFIVMELLRGRSLEDELLARGPLPASDAIDYVLQAIDALSEAHAAGIVHRDLKPANLFVAERPDRSSLVKVLDFGISKVTGHAMGMV